MNIGKAVIYTDGAALGNPGPAAIAAIIKDKQGKPMSRISQRIGTTTNNQAEYRAIIAALEEAIRLGANQVDINLDSLLIVRQISGKYRVRKATLKPLYHRVKQLQGLLKTFTITYIPRQQNLEAHSLANMALKTFSHPG
ncbi:MAG: ribonuclease HI family protein [Dehalococcoidales bacterium]|nr:ribonuclease HI family protein [Dehalococcoidales bacterium]